MPAVQPLNVPDQACVWWFCPTNKGWRIQMKISKKTIIFITSINSLQFWQLTLLEILDWEASKSGTSPSKCHPSRPLHAGAVQIGLVMAEESPWIPKRRNFKGGIPGVLRLMVGRNSASTSWYGEYPMLHRVSYITGGERRISEPSTVPALASGNQL